ncbi:MULTISPECIES: competence/damage-inducible protein A [Ureibacillus]|jgi:nicotinamide-nucleotide amidase|uniref:Putative competence-damage inducible protein n=1 Tax=Ureibacillus thermosphaericus TaxID=51173 RepID=A0A840PY79_URETH|nr:competence/damage-inducible protein A [Ureibacillus thermosphaericus]MBB5147806.1 nicotinamide-nucleotide amidase [Ureibacillus thermosphaericus]NKZ30392.1 competence/damage-inducible protein A [Ureibacillus thermosphaericus]
MNAEIIAVGSELLLGQIANTNAKFISSQLSELGINVYYHSVIGDNGGRLKKAIEIAESRADLIIFSGGLGPTKDDLTKETIAEHLNVPLVFDEKALETIEKFFTNQGRPLTENNRKQALVLQGSEVLVNHHGLAPGMLLQKGGRTYILLPGPPKELEPMFQFEVKPKLASLISKGGIILSHVLRFYGIGEAELETKIQHILDAQSNPTIAPLASDGEVTLRITAKADSKAEAWELINEKKREILSIVGKYNYGVDDDTLASKAVEMLLQNKLTISAAESLTAGLFQSELAEIPGVSGTLVGGMVTYTEEAKIQQLGIPKELLNQYGIVSSECAASMARNVRKKFGTDIGIGLTGAAGPEPHDGEPAGTIWIGIAIGEDVVTRKLQLSGLRNTNRLRTVKYTLSYLIRLLEEKGYQKV